LFKPAMNREEPAYAQVTLGAGVESPPAQDPIPV
jgi:hypothetical protein